MNRDYNNTRQENIDYFVGKVVEKTSAFDNDTLFVVGIKPVKDIIKLATRNNCDHIYLGANQSFHVTGDTGTEEESQSWDEMVTELLKAGLWVTLDYDVRYHEYVIESGYNEHDNFISMISVKLPYVKQLNYNACIKVDDNTFKGTNPGVWVSYVQEHLDRNKFTDWEKYTQDKPIKVDSEH